jgi:hypothetical protein
MFTSQMLFFLTLSAFDASGQQSSLTRSLPLTILLLINYLHSFEYRQIVVIVNQKGSEQQQFTLVIILYFYKLA